MFDSALQGQQEDHITRPHIQLVLIPNFNCITAGMYVAEIDEDGYIVLTL